MKKTNKTVWQYLNGILRYLDGTGGSKLVYIEEVLITIYINSNWSTKFRLRYD